jgi:hypothetical protein
MRIADLGSQPDAILEQAAELLVNGFDEPRGWPNLSLARDEVASILREGFALALLDADVVLGWVGGLPEYAGRVPDANGRGRPDIFMSKALSGAMK